MSWGTANEPKRPSAAIGVPSRVSCAAPLREKQKPIYPVGITLGPARYHFG